MECLCSVISHSCLHVNWHGAQHTNQHGVGCNYSELCVQMSIAVTGFGVRFTLRYNGCCASPPAGSGTKLVGVLLSVPSFFVLVRLTLVCAPYRRRPCGDADLCYDFSNIEKVGVFATTVCASIDNSGSRPCMWCVLVHVCVALFSFPWLPPPPNPTRGLGFGLFVRGMVGLIIFLWSSHIFKGAGGWLSTQIHLPIHVAHDSSFRHVPHDNTT